MSAIRMTPERLAEIRLSLETKAPTHPAMGVYVAELLAELDAMTRERDVMANMFRAQQ